MNNWNTFAKKYDALVGETGDVYHRTYINPVILKLAGDIKNKKVLDLACGQGYFSRILAKKGAKVTGIDITKNLLEMAEGKEEKEPLGIKYYRLDSGNLKRIKNNSFDIIISTMAFHDIKNIKATIKECSRVLKLNGRIIFSTLHPFRSIANMAKGRDGYYLKLEKYKSIVSVEHVFKGFGVTMYHRPLDLYLQEMFKNNFLVSNFFEISTEHHKGKKVVDSKLLAHKREMPIFLIVEGIKFKNKN